MSHESSVAIHGRETCESSRTSSSAAVITSDRGVLRLAEPLEMSDPMATAAGGISSTLLADVERHHITRVLKAKQWCIEGRFGAAAALGLKASTLRSRLRKLGISRPANAEN